MRRLLAVVLVLSTSSFSACTTPGSQIAAQGKTDLAGVTVCCKTLADATVLPLPTKQRVEVDKMRQAFTFDGGKSFFVMYRLPDFIQPYSIVLNSQPGGNVSNTSIFLPRVTLLDAKFVQTRHFSETGLRSRGSVFERTIFINPADAGERYMVIYGADLATPVDRVLSIVTTTTSPMFVWSSGADVKATLHPSPVGAFDIEAVDLPAPK